VTPYSSKSHIFSFFFSALKYAVERIAAIEYKQAFVVEPQEGIQLRYALNQSKSVFRQDGEVYKLYNENVLAPKIEGRNGNLCQ